MFHYFARKINQTKVNWKSALSISFLALTLTWLVGQPALASGSLKEEVKKPTAAESAEPFAKVYLALQGCTSCAACRSVIRQMTKGAAEDGKVSLPSDAVEINYAEPTTIPLKKVVGNLAKNRLHDLKLVDVLFDVSGQVGADSAGALVFTIETTGQQYAISIPEGVTAPPQDETLRLSAVVEGWRGSSDLTLKLKSFVVNN